MTDPRSADVKTDDSVPDPVLFILRDIIQEINKYLVLDEAKDLVKSEAAQGLLNRLTDKKIEDPIQRFKNFQQFLDAKSGGQSPRDVFKKGKYVGESASGIHFLKALDDCTAAMTTMIATKTHAPQLERAKKLREIAKPETIKQLEKEVAQLRVDLVKYEKEFEQKTAAFEKAKEEKMAVWIPKFRAAQSTDDFVKAFYKRVRNQDRADMIARANRWAESGHDSINEAVETWVSMKFPDEEKALFEIKKSKYKADETLSKCVSELQNKTQKLKSLNEAIVEAEKIEREVGHDVLIASEKMNFENALELMQDICSQHIAVVREKLEQDMDASAKSRFPKAVITHRFVERSNLSKDEVVVSMRGKDESDDRAFKQHKALDDVLKVDFSPEARTQLAERMLLLEQTIKNIHAICQSNVPNIEKIRDIHKHLEGLPKIEPTGFALFKSAKSHPISDFQNAARKTLKDNRVPENLAAFEKRFPPVKMDETATNKSTF